MVYPSDLTDAQWDLPKWLDSLASLPRLLLTLQCLRWSWAGDGTAVSVSIIGFAAVGVMERGSSGTESKSCTRLKTCPVASVWSGHVGLVCGMKRGILSIGIITCGFISGPDTSDLSPSTGVLILQWLNSRCSTTS